MDDEDGQQVHVRLPKPVYMAVEERAKRYHLSRNAWIVKALTRMVEMPPQVTTKQERF